MPTLTQTLTVRETPPGERPSARAAAVGLAALTLSEVVSLALNTDITAATSLVAAAQGTARGLFVPQTHKFSRPAHVKRLAAVRELCSRADAEAREDGAPIRSPSDVWRIVQARMEALPVEEFHALILDAQHRLERDITITRGILNSSLVHPREVFREAIAERCAAIIFVHNHPSGDPTPSADDRLVTEQLVAAGKLLDIPVHDHVIIGRGRYVSFAEAGLL